MNFKKYIGTKDFYRMTLAIAVPIMIQNGITNFVSLLDNIMIGRIGTDQMSGVSIVNQLMFVYNLCIFGGLAGIGIFTAQFYGRGDHDGIRYTFRLKLYVAALLAAVGYLVFLMFGDNLVSLYLHEDGGSGDPVRTLASASSYLKVMLFSLLIFGVSQVYSSTLRETGETMLPMKASLVAVAVNLVGNYILIFGKLGAPALGVVGAAIATVISRVVEFAILVVWTHRHAERNRYIVDVYKSLYVPGKMGLQMIIKGFPLLINEALWSAGTAVLSQNYSLRGLTVIAAFNISGTISNVFSVVFISMGSATAIILGQQLGAGRLKTAKEYAGKLAVMSVVLCTLTGLLQICVSSVFPLIYNTTDEVRHLATGLIIVYAVCSPMYAFENNAYFTIRSGGKTLITFFFDSAFSWVVSIPVLYCLVHFTDLPVLTMYAIVQSLELIKCVIGFILVRKGIWVQDLSAIHKAGE